MISLPVWLSREKRKIIGEREFIRVFEEEQRKSELCSLCRERFHPDVVESELGGLR